MVLVGLWTWALAIIVKQIFKDWNNHYYVAAAAAAVVAAAK